jgi:hypothetical protein
MVLQRSIELSSARCALRPITRDDFERVHELWTSPGIRRFLWDDEVIPREQTRAAIEQNEQMFAGVGYGLWGCVALGYADP